MDEQVMQVKGAAMPEHAAATSSGDTAPSAGQVDAPAPVAVDAVIATADDDVTAVDSKVTTDAIAVDVADNKVATDAKEVTATRDNVSVATATENATQADDNATNAAAESSNVSVASHPANTVSDFTPDQLFAIAMDFRQHIKLRTMLAFGCKHPRVFTGSDAVTCMQESVGSLFGDIKHQHGQISRAEARHLADVLVRDRLLFLPLGVQQRRFFLVPEEEEEGKEEHSVESNNDEDVADGMKSNTLSRKNAFNVADNEKTLYRLTGDTILLGEFSAKIFDDFLATVRDESTGVPLAASGKRLFRRVTAKDKYFSKSKFHSWMEANYGITAKRDVTELLKLFIRRRIIVDVPLSRFYQFV